MSDNSITTWYDQLQAGDSVAAQKLWEEYFDQLVGLARGRLAGTPRQMADEEDVALSAFKSVCVGARKGRFPDISDRESLWRLMVVITARKAADQANYNTRKKRDVGRNEAGGNEDDAMIDRMVGQQPTPEFAALLTEEFELRLKSLGEDYLRDVALLKMEGYTNDEIADKLETSLSTVERRLRLIRKLWQ